MVPFAGFEMPVQYPPGIRAEHLAVRQAAGLFDVSHMGEFRIKGPGALDLLQRVTVNDASRLEPGKAHYSAMCREDGGTVDDLLVYRLDEGFMLVVNAATRAGDLEWIRSRTGALEVTVEDRSDEIALLALQGPRAQEILEPLAELELEAIGFYRHARGTVAGVDALVSRTGYTGEDGFELYVDADRAPGLWREILGAGEGAGLLPAGLGARDSLRLEAGLPLYGNDLDENRSPVQAGLGWMVKVDKGDFVGREALARQKEEGVAERLAGLRLTGRGIPRAGYPLLREGERVGKVTSGAWSPSLEAGIALGYLPVALAEPGTEVEVEVRGRTAPARVERLPFYREGSLRR